MKESRACNTKGQNSNEKNTDIYTKGICEMLVGMKPEYIKRIYQLTKYLWVKS